MSELKILELVVAAPEGIRFTQSAGTVLHGVLMEHIDHDYADFLHSNQLNPYSQYVYFDRKRQQLLWRITALNKQAAEEVLAPAFSLPEKVFLKQKNWALTIKGKNYISDTSYDDVAAKYFTQECDYNAVEYKFLTSCSFKSNGEYVIFPNQQLILQSLVKKWNHFAESNKLDEHGIADELAKNTYVAGYNLSMNPFALEGTRIPAFRGTYLLAFKKNLMLKKIICMLSEFASFSGIGIKTSLGMGAANYNFIKW